MVRQLEEGGNKGIEKWAHMREVEGKKEVDIGSRYGWEQFLIVSSPEDGYEGGVDEEKGLLTSVRSVRVSIQLFYDKSTSLFLSDTSQGLL